MDQGVVSKIIGTKAKFGLGIKKREFECDLEFITC